MHVSTIKFKTGGSLSKNRTHVSEQAPTTKISLPDVPVPNGLELALHVLEQDPPQPFLFRSQTFLL